VVKSLPEVPTDQAFKDGAAKLGERLRQLSSEFPEIVSNPELEKLSDTLANKDKLTPQGAVSLVRKLRSDSKANIRNQDPNKQALGYAQRDAAGLIDDLLDRQITAAGKPGLVDRYKQARQTLAKVHDLESATNEATGDVDAQKLSKLQGRGAPLTGDLKTIADAATAFPKAMQPVARMGGYQPYSVLDMWAALGGTVPALMTGNMRDLAIPAAMLSRPLVRNYLLSHFHQFTPLQHIRPSVIRSAPANALARDLGKIGLFSNPGEPSQQGAQ